MTNASQIIPRNFAAGKATFQDQQHGQERVNTIVDINQWRAIKTGYDCRSRWDEESQALPAAIERRRLGWKEGPHEV